MSRKKLFWMIAVVVVLIIVAFLAISTPIRQGGSAHQVGGSLGLLTQPAEAHPIAVSGTFYKRKMRVRHNHHHFRLVRTRTTSAMRAAGIGPSYRIEAETHGDSWAIDKVVQGLGHFKICMAANDHTKILNKCSGASADHRESWFWNLNYIEKTSGGGISTTWCNGGVGPCKAVEYKYWRLTFQWKQGVDIFGQSIAHHSTQYIGCTLRSGGAGWHCGTGDVS